MKNRIQSLLENGIYVLIWVTMFFIPVFGYRTDDTINWQEVNRFWFTLLPFFILFVVNNYLLLPFLFLRKRFIGYILTTLLLIFLLFTVVPVREGRPPHPVFPERQAPPSGDRPADVRPFSQDRPPRDRNPEFRPRLRPMPVKWAPLFNDFLLAVLVIGFNIAIRLMFKSIADARRLKELESQALKAELNYLKAQVNPHFFMNTLNNIHALVDIDTEKAKETVIELAKIMRYMLYEADKPLVPLAKEVEFLNNYVALMRIRYSDEVDIRMMYLQPVPDIRIPPLLLITLLENAFKHGINYEEKSYIYSVLTFVDGQLAFSVRNSFYGSIQEKAGGGIENLRKRLDLLYDTRYQLDSELTDNEYVAELIIPVAP